MDITKYYRDDIQYSESSIRIQAIEWGDDNQQIVDDEDEYGDEEINEYYIIRCFGVDAIGNSVCLNITDFKPFFYIKVDESFRSKVFLARLKDVTGYYKESERGTKQMFYCKKNIIDEECKVYKRKDFYGYNGDKEELFFKIVCNNSKTLKKIQYIIQNHNSSKNKTSISGYSDTIFDLYESNVDYILRFLHVRELNPTGWLIAKNITVNGIKQSKCQIEATVKWSDISAENTETNAPILQASFDIEVYSVDGSMPSPKVKGNCIFQIGTTFKRNGSDNTLLRHIIHLGKCNDLNQVDGVETILECYDTEKEVILAWKNLIVKMDPDIFYSWNGDAFDFNYIVTRSGILKCMSEFLSISRLKQSPAIFKEEKFSSSAYGTTEFNRLHIPGRLHIDLLTYFRKEFKEDSYKLDDISEKYLDEKKNPVSVNTIFESYRTKDPAKLKIVADYCVQDTMLPQKLVDKLFILQAVISMSNVTYVPLKYIIQKGQQIRVFSQILKETRTKGYLVPCLQFSDEEKFEGATVLTPESGIYDEPVTVCDFASLYPSIMQAHNLCYSTFVIDNKYAKLDGVEYSSFDITNASDGIIKTTTYTFCKSRNGILPDLLTKLKESRKKYKKLMKESTDKYTKEIYNKGQLSVKISMNSIYGFLAANMLKCKPIAATVTAIGRQMIKQTKDFVMENYPSSNTIYGDTDSCFFTFQTKLIKKYKSEKERIYKHTVITQKDREHLDNIKTECIAEAIEIGKDIAKNSTEKLFKYPISLEYEKVYCPLLLLSKKRYIGNLYSENPESVDYQDAKGITLKRRDGTKLLKRLYQETIDSLLIDGSRAIPKIKDNLRKAILDIKNGDIDLDDLIITKAYKPPYKTNAPHATLAEKIGIRDPAKKPRSNDRISYLFVDIDNKKKIPQFNKVEDPDYVREHNLKLDIEYYITSLSKPLCEILSVFMKTPELFFADAVYEYKIERSEKLNISKPRENKLQKTERFRALTELSFGETFEDMVKRMKVFQNNITNTKIIDKLISDLRNEI